MDLPNKMLYGLVEREPNKRKVKPAQALFELDDLGESSDDSDFRIEDHCEESDDDSIDSAENGQKLDDGASSDSGSSDDVLILDETKDAQNYIAQSQPRKQFDPKHALKIMICSVCLGDRSDAINEIIECDNCGVTVHEGCYGVQESDSVCSTDSPNPTTPWFCDACKAGLEDPECELCPNQGGIYKETDVGKWVHLVCALYMPGVAFGEVDKLQNVTLFEMAYTKWGGKACTLCQDQRFARTGAVVGCDAGLCKTHFHATCGQREGLLAETHSEEVDQADPFYAHCKLHSDKNLLRKRKRNWLALQMRMDEIKRNKKDEDEVQRIQRRLGKYRVKYLAHRRNRIQPWVPTQKMGRLLTTSASACRALWRKAELSGADMESWALRQAQVDALSDVHRRWYIQPAFSVEFIGYYIDRNVRVTSMRKQLAELLDENAKLLGQQETVEESRDRVVKENTHELTQNQELKKSIELYHQLALHLAPNKRLPILDLLGRPVLEPPNVRSLAPTKKIEPSRRDSDVSVAGNLNSTCGLCKGRHDQHLLAKCDTCQKHYHLGCLNPPLARMPKKTKLMGWQCSECDKNSDSSDVEVVDPEAPRKLRKTGNGESSFFNDMYIYNPESPEPEIPFGSPEMNEPMETGESESFRNKKRKREKHHRYSPEPGFFKPHKHRKHKAKAEDEQRQSLKICFKSVPNSTGGGSSYVATPSVNFSPKDDVSFPGGIGKPTKKKEESVCVTCNLTGDISNLVRCDECLLGFHFQCLDPPVKKSPKVRGYSWHCANCDPTESE